MKTFILVIIAFIIGGGAVYYLTDTNGKTGDEVKEVQEQVKEQEQGLKYTNDQYGFSLSYRDEWEVQEALKPREARAVHEIVFHEREYDMVRAGLSVFVFNNDEGLSVNDWWNTWLKEEDVKEQECIDEYGEGNAPCLFLRGLIEAEEDTTIAGKLAHSVRLFRFDSEEECTYAAHNEFIFGICSDYDNPNDPKFEEHKRITDQMRASLAFYEPSDESNDVATLIIGRWQSVGDEMSVKIFSSDGITIEEYDGDVIVEGTWEIENNTLRTLMYDEEFLYTVVEVSQTELELTYLARGNTLRFTRVEE